MFIWIYYIYLDKSNHVIHIIGKNSDHEFNSKGRFIIYGQGGPKILIFEVAKNKCPSPPREIFFRKNF